MMSRKTTFLFLLISILLFIASFTPMLWVFEIPFTSFLPFIVFVLCLVGCFVSSGLSRTLLYLFISFLGVSLPNLLVNKISITSFILTEYQGIKDLIINNSQEYSSNLSFFLLLLFLVSLIEIQMVNKQILLVGCIIVFYLLLLNIFNDLSIVPNILLVIGLTLVARNLLLMKSNKLFLISSVFIIGLSFMSVLLPTQKIQASIIGFSAPYRSKIENKGLYAYINSRKYKEASSTGFDEDDSELGGALYDDETEQFKVVQKNPHYWRIDSKDTYTGKGWIASKNSQSQNSAFTDQLLIEKKNLVDETKEVIDMTFYYSKKYIPITYGDLVIRGADNTTYFSQNLATDRIDSKESNYKNQVEMTMQELAISDEQLKSSSNKLPKSEIDYLQLPNNFPKRIEKLTKQVTKDKTDTISKVRALEAYLKNNSELLYSKQEVSYPKEDQDYVDHFLFDSKVGYCNNYSTAMVTMLRTIKIPSRWVKGFNTGNVITKENDRDVYIIRNKDAHSWVEVYFEGFGWISFEPTPTFNQPQNGNKKENKVKKETVDSKELETKETSQSQKVDSKKIEKKNEVSKEKETTKNKKQLNLFLLILILILFCMLVLVVINNWFYVYTSVLLTRKNPPFEKIYHLILTEAQKKYPREKSMPLKEYAQIFENEYDEFNGAFVKLTTHYEAQLYNKSNQSITLKKAEIETVIKLLQNQSSKK